MTKAWIDRQFERLAERMFINGKLYIEIEEAKSRSKKKKLGERADRVRKGFQDIAKDLFSKMSLNAWMLYATGEAVDVSHDYTLFLEGMRRMAHEADARIKDETAEPSDFAKKYIGEQVLREYFESAKQGNASECFEKFPPDDTDK